MGKELGSSGRIESVLIGEREQEIIHNEKNDCDHPNGVIFDHPSIQEFRELELSICI
jgi:hypothetical protein